MASDYGENYGRPSTQSMHAARIDRYIGPELGRMQHHYLEGDHHFIGSYPHTHPSSSTQPHDLHKDVQREIEKERIRQEIIMSEIIKRRALEAEVRRELMVEMELALRGGSNGLHFGSPSSMGSDLSMRLPMVVAERRFLEERMMLSLAQTNNLSNRHENQRLSESLQFQSASYDVRLMRNSEDKPVLEGVKEKRKINLQTKAIENITGAAKAIENITGATKAIENVTGAKRALSVSDDTEPEQSNSKKKAKEEWRCHICQVSTSSERGLNEHLQGKKHKTKEAATGAQFPYSIGLTKQKVVKSITTADPGTKNKVKSASEPLPFSKSGDDQPLLQENSDSLKKDEPMAPEKVKKNEKEERIWCEVCQIGVVTQKAMDMHKMGKKHRRRLDKVDMCGLVFPSQLVEETMAKDVGTVEEAPKQDGLAHELRRLQDAVLL